MTRASEELNRPAPQRPVSNWMWGIGRVAVMVLLVILSNCALGRGTSLAPVATNIPPNTPTPTPPPTKTPTPKPLPELPPTNVSLHDTWIRPTDGMTMVYVPDGTFSMGSTEGVAVPPHPVTLDAFWIDQAEVANAQYALCVADGECDELAYADYIDYNRGGVHLSLGRHL